MPDFGVLEVQHLLCTGHAGGEDKTRRRLTVQGGRLSLLLLSNSVVVKCYVHLLPLRHLVRPNVGQDNMK